MLGGEAVVSTAVADDLGEFGDVTRFAGTDRFDTARMVAEAFDQRSDIVAIVTGRVFADGLVGVPMLRGRSPLLLVEQDSIPTATAAYLNAGDLRSIRVLGGPVAISEQVERELARFLVAS